MVTDLLAANYMHRSLGGEGLEFCSFKRVGTCINIHHATSIQLLLQSPHFKRLPLPQQGYSTKTFMVPVVFNKNHYTQAHTSAG